MSETSRPEERPEQQSRPEPPRPSPVAPEQQSRPEPPRLSPVAPAGGSRGEAFAPPQPTPGRDALPSRIASGRGEADPFRPVVPTRAPSPAQDEEPATAPSSIEMLIFHPGSRALRTNHSHPVPGDHPASGDHPAPGEQPATGDDQAGDLPSVIQSPPRDPSATRRPEPAAPPAPRPAPTLSAADHLRTFGLLRLLRQAELEERGFDVEARLQRSYRLRFSSAGSVRPEYHTAVLRSADRDRTRTYGLGVMFPPYTVHAGTSTGLPHTVGDNCELTQVDHVHVRRAEVPRDDALRSAPIREILAQARPDQDNSKTVRALRAALATELETPRLEGSVRLAVETRPLLGGGQIRWGRRAHCVTSLHEAHTVVLGDDAMTRLDARFVVERTLIPAGLLLAADESLARRYVELVADPHDDPAALAAFLNDLVAAAAATTGENLLGHADGLATQQPTLLGLFGLVSATEATSILLTVPDGLYADLGSALTQAAPSHL
ncbi:hypothetical protein [Actinoplanes siamensis]|uniref:Uncharacterized protein n=1 Tax=Actinoplanes siamensis TaxID=1223317 RepID=A0A919N5A7_9ACTN|nr:hypothetical protein [Actinoplanes siamensis]GIF04708.1 hypothetical protein Asi03nite_22460 [Actinoplanes siamensis]